MTRPIRYLLATLLALLVAPVGAQVATGSFERTLNVSDKHASVQDTSRSTSRRCSVLEPHPQQLG